MAHLDKIQPDLLTQVAREIGEFIDRGLKEAPKEPPPAGKTPLELGATLTIWTFPARTFEALAHSKVSGDLSDWLEPTQALYHQIWLRGKPAGFARSHRPEKGGKSAIFHLNESPLASQLHQFLEKIDHEEADPFLATDPVVRLLEIPPFHLSALWLFSESQHESRVLIIYAPKRYEGLGEGAMVSSKQFFDALSVGPISGITESKEELDYKSGFSPDQSQDEDEKST
jgi:hypothetical protein